MQAIAATEQQNQQQPRERTYVVGAGSVAIVLDLPPLRTPTLANLLGALSLPSSSEASLAGVVQAALHQEELDVLAAPHAASAGVVVRCRLAAKKSGANEGGNGVVYPAEVAEWNTALPSSEQQQQGRSNQRKTSSSESEAWSALLDAGSSKKGFTETAFLSIVEPLFKTNRYVSYDLLCKLLLVATGEFLCTFHS